MSFTATNGIQHSKILNIHGMAVEKKHYLTIRLSETTGKERLRQKQQMQDAKCKIGTIAPSLM